MRLPTMGERRAESTNARAEDGRSSGSGRWWKVLTALALGAIAYLAWRRTRSGEPVPWAGEAGEERADEAGESPDDREPEAGREVPIEGTTEEGAGGELSEGTAANVDPTLEEVDERVPEEEVDQRVSEAVDEEPAEPGELSVGEEVAEEADVGEGEDIAEDEADAAGEAEDAGAEDGSGEDEDDGGDEESEEE